MSNLFTLEKKRKFYLGVVFMLLVWSETMAAIYYRLDASYIMAISAQALSLAGGLGVVVYGYAKEGQHIASVEVAKCNGNGGTPGES